ncbi:hypothetical protein [Lacipirellula sp.]|uniref:hypothetical protein n=1 Tax=Lacipirellula sp. TaxID=2691419 RepID=UPI003D13DC38
MSERAASSSRRKLTAHRLTIALAFLASTIVGCGAKPEVVPVSGKVTYNGQPLPYGTVGFQPPQGQPSGAAIQPDGTFKLSTFAEFDGAKPGSYKVKVSCYASQSPSERAKPRTGEFSTGASLIPEKYAFVDRSELTAEVPADGTDAIVLELTGPEKKFPQ